MNNGSKQFPANVAYLELNLPSTFPLQLRKFIPNINFDSVSLDGERELRIIALGIQMKLITDFKLDVYV